MAPRLAFWTGGFLLGIIAAAFVPESLFPGARVVVFGACLAGLGLTGEVVELLQTPRHRAPRLRPRDQTEGKDGLISLPGAQRTPNTVHPRLGAFSGRAADGVEAGPRPVPADDRMVLLGRCCLASIFIGHDGRSWTDEAIVRADVVLDRAALWLETEATRWNASLEVVRLDTYFVVQDEFRDEVEVQLAVDGDDAGPFEARAAEKLFRLASRAAVSVGFEDISDLVQWVGSRVDADSVAWIVHPLREGRSFAVSRAETLVEGVGLAVCYCREASFPSALSGEARTDPVSVVHEMLHLFGASDKYGQALREYAPGLVSSRDVMRLSEERLSRLRVDSLTAFEVGWTERLVPETRTTATRPNASKRSSRVRE